MHSTFLKIFSLILFVWAPAFCVYSEDAYKVQFEGVHDEEMLKLLQSVSKTIELKENSPSTQAGLKRRAEGDIQNLVKSLQSLAYYNAKIDVDIQFKQQPPLVNFRINPGPIYTLSSFKVVPIDPQTDWDDQQIPLQDLGITIGRPAFPKNIIEAEDLLLNLLEKKGYPLAKIDHRDVTADQSNQTISVILYVDAGPRGYFGPVTLIGLKKVSPRVFSKKVAWCFGDLYDPCKIEKTQNALEATRLFSSISITHANEVREDGMLPIEVEVLEGKHRSVGAGVGYSTDNGFGALAEWEHRNIRGDGERLSFKTLIAQRLQEGTITYLIPDFKIRKQDLIWQAEFQRQTTKGYHASSYSFSGIIERQLNDRTRISYGGMFKRLRDTHSDNNGSFNLIKTPLQLRWRNTDNILDPTEGQTLHLKVTPSLQVLHPQFAYCINTLTTTFYLPLRKDRRLVLAGKATFGSIFGKKRHSIPPSERFYAGNENLLRGYHYMTVSPLRGHEPIGGRSMMIYSLEARLRATETLGGVLFYDFGNVYENYLPQFDKKILQSVGFGLRYNTPVGPLRLDFAVPLHRRRHIDENFQIYLSIGQAF